MILEVPHTHLYPGLRGEISGLARLGEVRPGSDCMVAFSDGSLATARISDSEVGWLLRTNGYRTAAGTDIEPKCWLIRVAAEGDRVRFRVVRKVAA